MRHVTALFIGIVSLTACDHGPPDTIDGHRLDLVEAPLRRLVLHVDDDAAPGGDGSGRAPFADLGEAVAQAQAGGGGLVLIAPGTYTRSAPLFVGAGITLRGASELEVDDDGWPTGVIRPGTETRIVGQGLGDRALIEVGAVAGPVIRDVSIEGLSLEAGNTTGNVINIVKVQRFTVRGNVIRPSSALAGISPTASTGRIVGNHMSGLGCGACIDGGNPSSPAVVDVVGNRSVGQRNGGVLLSGPGVNLPASDNADLLIASVRDNDLSDSVATARTSFGLRVMGTRPNRNGAAGDTMDHGTVIALIAGNRIAGNEVGVVVDAGFPYRQARLTPTLPLSCDPRRFDASFALVLRDNEVVGNRAAPALISFTRLTTSVNRAQLPSWQYLHGARTVIDDRGGDLAGYWLDHLEVDPFVGGLCADDATSEPLDNKLFYNGREIATAFTVP